MQLKSACGLALALGTILLAASPLRAETTLRFSTFGAENNPISNCAWLSILDEITASSNGEVKFEKLLGATAFGNPTKQLDFLSQGLTDMSVGVIDYSGGAYPLISLATAPFIVTDGPDATIAINDVIRSRSELMAEFDDIHFIGLAALPPSMFHLREKIDSLDGLKGKRVRVVGQLLTDVLKEFGAQPVALPAVQAYENLQKGVIDGTAAGWSSVTANSLNEVVSAHYEVGFGPSFVVVGMSKPAYAKLSPEAKAAVDAVSTGKRMAKSTQCFDDIGVSARKEALDLGHPIVTATPEQKKSYTEKVAPIIDAYIDELEGQGLPAREVYDEFRDKISKAENEKVSEQ